jgi:hypothetical protein
LFVAAFLFIEFMFDEPEFMFDEPEFMFDEPEFMFDEPEFMFEDIEFMFDVVVVAEFMFDVVDMFELRMFELLVFVVSPPQAIMPPATRVNASAVSFFFIVSS